MMGVVREREGVEQVDKMELEGADVDTDDDTDEADDNDAVEEDVVVVVVGSIN
jgi:hypothetical protein